MEQSVSTIVVYGILRINTTYGSKVIQSKFFNDDLGAALSNKPTHLTIVCADSNAKIGIKIDPSETALGNFGSAGRNDRGKTRLNFLLEKNLFLMNSVYNNKPQRRWT